MSDIPIIHHLTIPAEASPAGEHAIAYAEWGETTSPNVALCVHGLSRNNRDFDYLAKALAPHYRVIAVDVVGRGKSDWLDKPEHYRYATYIADILYLLDTLNIPQVHWIGTSMGGIIGMLMAKEHPERLRTLLVNDIGPVIPGKALMRIARYVHKQTTFPDRAAAEAAFRTKLSTFGIREEEHWQHLLAHSIEPHGKGQFRFTYDPGIIKKPTAKDKALEDVLLWEVWEEITHPTLVLRGGDSDILLPETAEEMRHTGPKAELVTFKGVGHAPALMESEQIGVVREWLGR